MFSHIFRPDFMKYNSNYTRVCMCNWDYVSNRREKYMIPPVIYRYIFTSLLSIVSIILCSDVENSRIETRDRRIYSARTKKGHVFSAFFTSACYRKRWIGSNAQERQTLPFVFSYISPSVCSYNLNYTCRSHRPLYNEALVYNYIQPVL